MLDYQMRCLMAAQIAAGIYASPKSVPRVEQMPNDCLPNSSDHIALVAAITVEAIIRELEARMEARNG